MHTTLKLTLTALAALAFSASTLAAEYTMRVSHQYPPTHQVAKAIEQFAAAVEKNTEGKVDVQVFGANQLFKPNQNHAAVASGQIEAAAIINFQWGGTIPEMSATSIPYLVTSAEALKKFPASDAAKLLNAKMEEKGVHNIAWMVDANDGIMTSAKKPLVAPADFKGIKIRGLNKLFDAGLRALGASPTSMPGSEVYQALQTGVIDAGFTGVDAAFSRRYYEVQKYGVASPIISVYSNLVVNPAWWAKLPGDVKKEVMSAAAKAEAVLLPTSDEIPPESIQRLRDKGMQVTVLTKEQQDAMAAVMQPAVIKAFVDSSPDGAKLLELIKKL
ncbi:MAG TPA: TRAP transporter substrate-binding protein DctP [Burkholderiaceae bacterium]|nr:TRAP transporter substrate-binding protein DctP [Burkholderiaceae bacterium]